MAQENQQQIPPPHLNKKDLELIQNYVKEVCAEQVSGFADFIPEILERKGLMLVPVETWKTQVKRLAATFAVAAAGTLVANAAIGWSRKRREKAAIAEFETPANGQSKKLGGARLSVA